MEASPIRAPGRLLGQEQLAAAKTRFATRDAIGSWWRAKSEAHSAERARRSLNVVAAALLLVATLPLMLLIAVCIKLSSRGPVLYAQDRIGLDRRNGTQPESPGRRQRDLGGRPFTMLKFRTMTYSPSDDDQVWATPDDPRVTPIGRVLRQLRMDELPQLVNVLKGDMNLVGPRPEQPDIFHLLREGIDRYAERQLVRPGITGWAQVNQPYDLSFSDVERKLQYDLDYIHQRSTGFDLQIILRTIPVVLTRFGAW